MSDHPDGALPQAAPAPEPPPDVLAAPAGDREPTSEPPSDPTPDLTAGAALPAAEPDDALPAEPVPTTVAAAEPAPERTDAVSAEPEATPERAADPAPEPALEPAAEPAPEPAHEPTAEPEPAAEHGDALQAGPVTATEPAPTTNPAAHASPPAPRPAPPRPRPRPRPGPARRGGGAPGGGAPGGGPDAAPATAPAGLAPAPPVPGVEASDPHPWGRVDAEGTVYVRTGDGERPVGSYPGATADEALAYFGRKYDELVAQVALAEQRLSVPDVPPKDVSRALDSVRGTLPEAAVVGNLAGLQARIDAVDAALAQRRKEAEAARRAAKEEARVQRLALVEEAEGIAATDPARLQWKAAGERMGVLFEAWKAGQRSGVRLDKPVEDELWKRFSHARTAFDRARRHHFAQLSTQHAEAKAAKERLVAEAEALSTSTSWAQTSSAYRGLMEQWKAAGRASRKEDDALWARFRAAQDVFFAARNADAASQDAEFTENLRRKEALLTEAEAILPVRDLAAAKSALRSVQDRWDEVGKVPRADMSRIERRMRTVEEAVKAREDDRWKRSNPEGRARAEGALGQLEDSIAGLERDLALATERGDRRRVREAEEALAARRAWLEQVRRAAQDFS